MTKPPASPAAAALSRAQAAVDLRRWDEAAREASQAIAADPTKPAGYALFAQALSGQGKLPAALDVADRGLAVGANHDGLHRVRGAILLDLGRLTDALAAIDEAIRIAPDHWNGHALRARIQLRARHLTNARTSYRRALALAPAEASLHVLAGDVELSWDNWPEAEIAYRAALRIEPNHAHALNNLGVALTRLRLGEQALFAFKAAVRADPTFAAAKRNVLASIKRLRIAFGITVAIITIVVAIALFVALASTGFDAGASGDEAVFLLGLILAGFAIGTLYAVISRLVRHARAWRRLHRLDPELANLYQQLARDKRAGRL